MTKDYFSGHSKVYATFRPTYPDALYHFIYQHLRGRDAAWDCATGNGQVAVQLSKDFKTVWATDISQQQLDHAVHHPNIIYSKLPAEKTNFEDSHFDLITVAQALHWFNTKDFYTEVRRVSKPGALLAVWGYALLSVNPTVDKMFLDFYENVVGPFWDDARRLVENEYRDIDFPFDAIAAPSLSIVVNWNFQQFIGYLSTWSATQKYIKVNGYDPVQPFSEELQAVWPVHETKVVTFPLFTKLGIVHK